MKVNESKTDLCIFHKLDTIPLTISVNGQPVTSKSSINVLGITFDSKMHWDKQVCQAITKSKKALCAIKLIKRFFTNKELLQLITANFYSVLYYGSEIWHIPTLKQPLKQKLLSASACALKLCMNTRCDMISFVNLHVLNQRATPEKLLVYKHALLLHKFYNGSDMGIEWQMLNLLQVFTSRQTNFKIHKGNTSKVGINALANRFHILNDLIPLSWLNLSRETFKVKCKALLL